MVKREKGKAIPTACKLYIKKYLSRSESHGLLAIDSPAVTEMGRNPRRVNSLRDLPCTMLFRNSRAQKSEFRTLFPAKQKSQRISGIRIIVEEFK